MNWKPLRAVTLVVTLACCSGSLVYCADPILPEAHGDYSMAYWRNGWRKHQSDPSPDLLCIETGHYGLQLDLADFRNSRFGLLRDATPYEEALRSRSGRIDSLPQVPLQMDVCIENDLYQLRRCLAAESQAVKNLTSARLWESGQLVQHYDILDLVFENAEGKRLNCDARLDLVAWPGALAINLHIAPREGAWQDASIDLQLADWQKQDHLTEAWAPGQEKQFTLACVVDDSTAHGSDTRLSLSTPTTSELPVTFREDSLCQVATVRKLKRSWNGGYRDIRNYDEFDIVVQHDSPASRVPFLLDLYSLPNVTGLCPILCDTEGRPTGIPIQLSKNWHDSGLGWYLRAYALLPARKGTTAYKLRICYGFYGTLPAASHAQLSLVGYGDLKHSNNGQWDQLAIGCWGETMCFDLNQSCVDNVVTDVRLLMVRAGRLGGKWNWTDAGWGGDWLQLRDPEGGKLFLSGLKTAYLSHGPCLSDVHYTGYFGAERNLGVDVQLQTLRTDDYARTFQRFTYRVLKRTPAEQGRLFTMGGHHHLVTPTIAYGNRDGLLEERQLPLSLRPTASLDPPIQLSGAGPWWIALPDGKPLSSRRRATGTRGLIIRDFEAHLGGTRYAVPGVRTSVASVASDGTPNVKIHIVPPVHIDTFEAGDRMDMQLEWVTLPRIAADYYGPNEAFLAHLEENPKSWKTLYREARGNDLLIEASGADVLERYPIVLAASAPKVAFTIHGGVGAVPLRIKGLTTRHHTLHEQAQGRLTPFQPAVHGNDFWQTDYNPQDDTYTLTFNLPLDGKPVSSWVLLPETSPPE